MNFQLTLIGTFPSTARSPSVDGCYWIFAVDPASQGQARRQEGKKSEGAGKVPKPNQKAMSRELRYSNDGLAVYTWLF